MVKLRFNSFASLLISYAPFLPTAEAGKSTLIPFVCPFVERGVCQFNLTTLFLKISAIYECGVIIFLALVNALFSVSINSLSALKSFSVALSEWILNAKSSLS